MGGPAGGGVVGYDYQTGRTVFGIEGEWNWANINGTSGIINQFSALGPQADSYLTRVDSYATVRGRLGYAFGAWDETLVYVDGGGVWGRVVTKYTNPFGPFAPNGAIATNNTASSGETGFVVGVGVEYALYWGAHPTNFTVKAEYNYISLPAPSIAYNAVAANKSTFSDSSMNTFQLGVNYRFNWGG
jgi:outer membrane immunogenic protein